MGAAPQGDVTPRASVGTVKRPFWMHQVAEFILGGALLGMGLQSPTPVVPAVVGGVVALHAASTDGPLSAFKVVPRRVHRVIDIGVICFALFAAVQPWVDCDGGTRVIVAVVAGVHAFVWWQTNFATRPSRAERRAAAGTRPPGDLPDDRATQIGRSAGRMAGRAVKLGRDMANRRSGPDH